MSLSYSQINLPFPHLTRVNSKLPRRGLEGLKSTSTSPKVWRKSATNVSALRLNTCQDLLKLKTKELGL